MEKHVQRFLRGLRNIAEFLIFFAGATVLGLVLIGPAFVAHETSQNAWLALYIPLALVAAYIAGGDR